MNLLAWRSENQGLNYSDTDFPDLGDNLEVDTLEEVREILNLVAGEMDGAPWVCVKPEATGLDEWPCNYWFSTDEPLYYSICIRKKNGGFLFCLRISHEVGDNFEYCGETTCLARALWNYYSYRYMSEDDYLPAIQKVKDSGVTKANSPRVSIWRRFRTLLNETY